MRCRRLHALRTLLEGCPGHGCLPSASISSRYSAKCCTVHAAPLHAALGPAGLLFQSLSFPLLIAAICHLRAWLRRRSTVGIGLGEQTHWLCCRRWPAGDVLCWRLSGDRGMVEVVQNVKQRLRLSKMRPGQSGTTESHLLLVGTVGHDPAAHLQQCSVAQPPLLHAAPFMPGNIMPSDRPISRRQRSACSQMDGS